MSAVPGRFGPLTGGRAFRRLAGAACPILACAARAVGLTKGSLGTRREAYVGAPIALVLALAPGMSGLWPLAGGRMANLRK